MTWTIRRATVSDASAIHAQVQATYTPWRGRLPEASIFDETVEQVEQSFGAGVVWLAADCDGTVLASARAEVVDDGNQGRRFLELHRLAVLPSAAGQGLGRAMMDVIEDFARHVLADQQRVVVALEVRIAQPASRQFYERRGYVQVGIGAVHRDGTPRTLQLERVLST